MNKLTNPLLETDSPAIGTEGTFGSVWRSYRANPMFKHSDMTILRRALASMTARLRLRHVRHVGFEQLSSVGYDVLSIQ